MRVYIKTLGKHGSIISETAEGWTWVQVESEAGVNHRHLAEKRELEGK